MSQTNQPLVFISYSSADRRFARRLAERISLSGAAIWLDDLQLKIGDSIPDKIADAISNVNHVVAIISSNSVKSPWVKKELAIAMTREVKTKKCIVLPVLIDDCDIPEFICDKVYADFRNSRRFEHNCQRLLTAIGLESKQRNIEHGFGGILIEWTELAPQLKGMGTVISSEESYALLTRFDKAIPKVAAHLKKSSDNVDEIKMYLGAILHAFTETYIRVPEEEEMIKQETGLSRKYELFWKFVSTMGFKVALKREKRSGGV